MGEKLIDIRKVVRPSEEGITFGMIVLNEHNYLPRSISSIKSHSLFNKVRIVVIDGGSVDGTQDLIKGYGCDFYDLVFNGHYGDQKNLIMRNVCTPWTFILDADEVLPPELLSMIPDLISSKEYDAYEFSRKNIIDGKETGVYPDYQIRLFRSYCRFIYPVHEELIGYKNKKTIDVDITHDKKSGRHNARNKFYNMVKDVWKHQI